MTKTCYTKILFESKLWKLFQSKLGFLQNQRPRSFCGRIQRLETAYKNNHFEWRKTRLKNKSRGNLCNCDSLLTTRCVFPTKTNPRTNFWIKTNVTSIPMKFEALLGLLASLYKSRVWRYIWNDTSRRIRKNKTLDLKKSFEYEHQCFSALLKNPFATSSWGNQHIQEPIKLNTF